MLNPCGKDFPVAGILEVSPDEVDYFKRNRPLHYLALTKMLAHGEARIVQSPGVQP